MIRTTILLPLDSHGLVLLQQRSYDAPSHAGMWSSFGGLVEEGEEPLAGARRELKEELELSREDSELEHFGTFPMPEEDRERYAYILRINDTEVPVFQEGRGMGYFTREQAATLEMPPHLRKILDAYWGSIS